MQARACSHARTRTHTHAYARLSMAHERRGDLGAAVGSSPREAGQRRPGRGPGATAAHPCATPVLQVLPATRAGATKDAAGEGAVAAATRSASAGARIFAKKQKSPVDGLSSWGEELNRRD